jgi:hypothetical protein
MELKGVRATLHLRFQRETTMQDNPDASRARDTMIGRLLLVAFGLGVLTFLHRHLDRNGGRFGFRARQRQRL